MGLFGVKDKVTKEQKRHDLYRDRFLVARGSTDRLRHAIDYVRAVCAVMHPMEAERVAQELFDFAAKANGTHGR